MDGIKTCTDCVLLAVGEDGDLGAARRALTPLIRPAAAPCES